MPRMPGSQLPTSSGGRTQRYEMDSSSTNCLTGKLGTIQARELSRFKGWLEKRASWLCLVHNSFATRKLWTCHTASTGYSRVDNVVKAQIAFYRIQEANGLSF